MRRLLVPLAFIAATAIVGGGLGLALQSRGVEGATESRPRPSLAVVAAGVNPPVHAFGDPVVAEVVLAGDARLIRPESVRITPDFSPYERDGRTRVERTGTGSSLRWHFRFPLRCLREGCAPNGLRRSFEFPLTSVVYRFKDTPGPGSVIIDWPRFEVTGLVDSEALTRRSWRANVTSMPGVTYRWEPEVLTGALLAGSAALGALASGIVWWFGRRRALDVLEALEERDTPTATPLAQALELAIAASRNGAMPERRKALERVARELGARGHHALAERARALAWAASPPGATAVEELAHDTRDAANGAVP